MKQEHEEMNSILMLERRNTERNCERRDKRHQNDFISLVHFLSLSFNVDELSALCDLSYVDAQ